MSIQTSLQSLSEENMHLINTDLYIQVEAKNKYGGQVRYISPYDVSGDILSLPFAYSLDKLKLSRPKRETYIGLDGEFNVPFEGSLRVEQQTVRQEAVTTLNKKGSVIVSAYPGFGKTIGAINLACTVVKLPTVIIVNKIVLLKQWADAITKFAPRARVKILSSASEPVIMGGADFYIINAINVRKYPPSTFSHIGFLIVDEAHLIMAEMLSLSMQRFAPRYVLALTATPYRPDGLDALIELYFGKVKIERRLYRKHTVYKVNTGFKPPVEIMKTGKVNWGVILDAQANDERRNRIVLDIVANFPERVFMILTKRVQQGKYLLDKLRECGESVTSLIGSEQNFQADSRVLIGTCQKIGVGFDHSRLNTLLLAADVEEYFVQYLGRVFRTQDVEPIIFDLVDDNSILKRHFASRKSVYKLHGGEIKQLAISSE